MGDRIVEELVPPIETEDFAKFCELMDNVIERFKGRFSLELLLKDLNAGECRAWCIRDENGLIRSAACSRIIKFRSGLVVLRGEWGSGTLEDAMAAEEQMVQVARASGAVRIQLEGRHGWLRALGGPWREVSRVIEREI